MCIGYKKHNANIVSWMNGGESDENQLKMIKKVDVFDRDSAYVTVVI